MGVDEPRGSLHPGTGPLAAWTPRGDVRGEAATTTWPRLWSAREAGGRGSGSSLSMGFINQHNRLCSLVQQNCSDMGGTRCFTPCRPVPLLPMDVAAHSLPEPVRCDGPSHKAARTFHPAAVSHINHNLRITTQCWRLPAASITYIVQFARREGLCRVVPQSRRLSASISRGASHFVEGGCAVVGGQTACGGGVVAPRPPHHPLRPTQRRSLGRQFVIAHC